MFATQNTSVMKTEIGLPRWFDLPVPDLNDAMSFYEGLFQWEFQVMENAAVPDYCMIKTNGHLIGGLRLSDPRPPDNGTRTASPILYFNVDKLQRYVQRAKDLGAKLVGQPIDLGNGRGAYQWFRDRAGNLVALWAKEL